MKLSHIVAKLLLLENVSHVLETLDELLRGISVPADLIGGVALVVLAIF